MRDGVRTASHATIAIPPASTDISKPNSQGFSQNSVTTCQRPIGSTAFQAMIAVEMPSGIAVVTFQNFKCRCKRYKAQITLRRKIL